MFIVCIMVVVCEVLGVVGSLIFSLVVLVEFGVDELGSVGGVG